MRQKKDNVIVIAVTVNFLRYSDCVHGGGGGGGGGGGDLSGVIVLCKLPVPVRPTVISY